jgi:hypothetical protein
VTSQLLDEIEIESSEPFSLREILPGPAWVPFGPEACDLPCPIDYASEARVEEENCPRGVLVAFCLEAVVALGLYGGWHALHFVR